MSYRGTCSPGPKIRARAARRQMEIDHPEPQQHVFDVTEADRFCATLSQEDTRFHKPDPSGRRGLVRDRLFDPARQGRSAGGCSMLRRSSADAEPGHEAPGLVVLLVGSGSYTLVPATQPPASVATPLVITMFADEVLNFQNADDQMPDLALRRSTDSNWTPRRRRWPRKCHLR